MAEHLTKDEHKVLQSDLSSGSARIHVTRSMARQFFIKVTNRKVRDLTGVSVLGQKLLVLALLATALILIVTCLVLTALEFGSAAVFAVPLVGIFWTVIVGLTTNSGSMLLSTLLLIPCLLLAYYLPVEYVWLLGNFIASIYCYRVAHILAQNFLVRLVSSSYDAYDMLDEQIVLTRDTL
ncbi:MAG: hypothetical protein ACI9YR_001527 [Bacteroidia bacterium]|jgi:hypothetical protein